MQFIESQIDCQCWKNEDKSLLRGETFFIHQAFYLDVQNAAMYSGTVVSVQYCYYNPAGGRNEAFIGIYRPMTDQVNNVTSYVSLTNSLKTIGVNPSFNTDGLFACGSVALQLPVSVIPGDVFGVCFNYQNGNNHLPVVGTVPNDNSFVLVAHQACGKRSTVFASNELFPVSNRQMHMYGNFQTG